LNTPPKLVYDHVTHLQPEFEEGGPDGSVPPHSSTTSLQVGEPHGLQQTTEPLPVLQAFQEFLEAERRRTRRRMVALASFFILLIACIGAVIIFVGGAFMHRADEQMEDMEGDIYSLRRTALEAHTDARQAVASVDRAARGLRNELQRERQTLTESASLLTGEMGAYRSRLGKVDEVLEMLALENATMRSELDTMSARWLTAGRKEGAPSARRGTASLAMKVAPQGGRAVSWRLPIPE